MAKSKSKSKGIRSVKSKQSKVKVLRGGESPFPYIGRTGNQFKPFGDDLFPWPWHISSSLGQFRNFSSADKSDEVQSVESTLQSYIQSQLGINPFHKANRVEIYLIRGLNDLPVGDSATGTVVIFPPEFLFVFDVGLPSMIGLSVPWDAKMKSGYCGFGDAGFPDIKRVSVKSIRDRTRGRLLYPDIAGQLILGLVPDVPPNIAIKRLTDAALSDVSVSGTFATGHCAKFREISECERIVAQLGDLVRYAEPNQTIRLVDLNWTVVRLA